MDSYSITNDGICIDLLERYERREKGVGPICMGFGPESDHREIQLQASNVCGIFKNSRYFKPTQNTFIDTFATQQHKHLQTSHSEWTTHTNGVGLFG